MSIFLAAVLIIGGIAGALVIMVATPLLLGAMAYDLSKTRSITPAQIEDAEMRIAVERGVARGFVLLGGGFWSVAAFAGLYSFRESGMSSALLAASIPMIACAATLIIGWYFERVAAALLALASVAVVAWGVVYQFEPGLWIIMTLFLIGPMMTAATLFWLARREQEALELALSLRLELAPVPITTTS